MNELDKRKQEFLEELRQPDNDVYAVASGIIRAIIEIEGYSPAEKVCKIGTVFAGLDAAQKQWREEIK